MRRHCAVICRPRCFTFAATVTMRRTKDKNTRFVPIHSRVCLPARRPAAFYRLRLSSHPKASVAKIVKARCEALGFALPLKFELHSSRITSEVCAPTTKSRTRRLSLGSATPIAASSSFTTTCPTVTIRLRCARRPGTIFEPPRTNEILPLECEMRAITKTSAKERRVNTYVAARRSSGEKGDAARTFHHQRRQWPLRLSALLMGMDAEPPGETSSTLMTRIKMALL